MSRWLLFGWFVFVGWVVCIDAEGAEHEGALGVLERACVACHNSHEKKGGVWFGEEVVGVEDLGVILEAVESGEMPKDREGLSEEEVALLRAWVGDGARVPEGRVLRDRWEVGRDWWSLEPIRAVEVSGLDQTGGWGRNAVDVFVWRKLLEKGLEPSREAEPGVLVRRLTYDLTGLPPTREEVEGFLAEWEVDAEGAYGRLVERLLASPRYGEQWGRLWLDVARYGESHGYDKDKARFHAWPYRDYVIESFNADKPWGRFVQEQVAGDVLWPESEEGVVATGFVAAGPWDFIAHVEVGEEKVDGRIAKHLDRDEMVSAVFNGFMSTTVQCAQCHAHKFDPVSMEDYYRAQAVFAAVDRRDRVYGVDAEVAKRRVALEEVVGECDRRLRGIAKKIEGAGGEVLKRLRGEVARLEKEGGGALEAPREHGYHSGFAKRGDVVKWVQLDLGAEYGLEEVRLRGAYDDFGGIGAGFGFPVRFKVEVADDAGFTQNVQVLMDETGADFGNPGLEPVVVRGEGKRGRFLRVTGTKLAKRVDVWVMALGEIEVVVEGGEEVARRATVSALDSIEAGVRWGRNKLVDGKWAKGGEVGEKLVAARRALSERLGELETPAIVKERKGLRARRDEAAKELKGLPEGKMVFGLATHFKSEGKAHATKGKAREIRVLHRGDVRSPGEVVGAGAPVLWDGKVDWFDLEEGASEGERRAALAKYLTDWDNPLVWRSAVNRIWAGHFGRGIVDSPNDFGRMGMRPTHPELLDWLAYRFREKQSVKDLHRLIVMSATYRQVSDGDAGKAAVDSENRFYWRMQRRKLRAEEVRDAVLAVAGKLDLKMGGPSFRDFRFKNDHTPKYWYHLHDPNDVNSHRRSVYRFIARSQTQPFLTVLDCADPSQVVAKRDETTTALQALVLMNNPFMMAMSEAFGERVAGDVDGAIWLALGRAATVEERELIGRYAEEHGWTAAARLIFNLNEFVYVD